MPFLIDSNVIVYAPAGDERAARYLRRLAERGERPAVSVVTRIEVLGRPSMSSGEDVGVRRLLEGFATIPLSDAVVEETVRIRRSVKIKPPDAIIAATAMMLRAPIVTHDRRDFARVPGLNVIDPMAPEDEPPGRRSPPTGATQAREPGTPYRKTRKPTGKSTSRSPATEHCDSGPFRESWPTLPPTTA